MNENMFLDPITNTWHACPKTKKQATTGPDSERWKASMEKELDTIDKMGVWKETSYLPRGEYPLPCKFVYNSRLRVTDVYLNGTAFGRLETCQKNEFTMSQMS